MNDNTQTQAPSEQRSLIKDVSQIVSTLAAAAGIVWIAFQANTTLQKIAIETDVKIMQIFVAELLPKLTYSVEKRVSDTCFRARVEASGIAAQKLTAEILNEVSYHCTFGVPGDRNTEVAAYTAVVELARKYEVICPTAKATLEARATNLPDDETLQRALAAIGTCK